MYTDEQLTTPGVIGGGRTHALNTVLRGAAGGFGHDAWMEHQEQQEREEAENYKKVRNIIGL